MHTFFRRAEIAKLAKKKKALVSKVFSLKGRIG